MGELLETVKVFVSPCEKLMTIVSGAIGKVYEPRHIRKMADARAYELSKIGTAIGEFGDLKIVYEGGELALSTEGVQGLPQRTQIRMLQQEMKKQQNIENVVDKAYEILKFENDVTNDPVDPDWINRFFNIIGDISNNEMQEVWAQILSGEIKRPGNFSMRTLETIRNMSTEEAQVFQRIIPLIVHCKSGYFVLSNSDTLSEHGVSYSDILILDESGLMDSSGLLSLNMEISKDNLGYILSDKFLIAIKGNKENNEKISIGVYKLTKAGQELFNILEHESNEDYIIQIAKYIFSNNTGKVTTSVHKSIILEKDVNEEKFQYDSTPLILYPEKADL